MNKGEIKVVIKHEDFECAYDWDCHDSFMRGIDNYFKENGYVCNDIKSTKNERVHIMSFTLEEDK